MSGSSDHFGDAMHDFHSREIGADFDSDRRWDAEISRRKSTMERYDPTTEALSPANRALINRAFPGNRGVTKWMPMDLDRLLDAARREAAEAESDGTREALKTAFVAGCCAVLTWTHSGMPQDDLDEAGYDYAASVLK